MRTINEAVMMEMIHHEGRGRAIGARELAAVVGVDERTIRDAVSSLVKDHRIGSSPSCGYFLIVDREDKELASRHIRSRIFKMLERLREINGTSVNEEAEQLKLFGT